MSDTPPPAIATLVVATHNAGKLREISALLAPFAAETVSAGDLGLPEPEETGDTFVANAALKAEAAATATGLPALSDDSGIEVTALDGAPGIHTARWAGEPRDFRVAMDRVWHELTARGATDVSAAFVCVLALARPGEPTQFFEGRVEGTLVYPPRGDRGFGFDPMFVPVGETDTFGEMDPAKKHAMSHRARAFDKLIAARFAA